MQIFNFVFLSVIITSHNVLTPHITKTHLPIVSLNVRMLKRTRFPYTYGMEASPITPITPAPHPHPLSFNTY